MATKFRFNYNNQTVDFDDYYVRSDIFTQGNLWGWGYGSFGTLGDNTTLSRSSPVQTVAGGINWKQVANGITFTVAIKTDGTLWSWGLNAYGQLGTNTTTSRSSPVQTITGGTNWVQVACGNYHAAAIKTDGTLWLWGYNYWGQIGNNTSGPASPFMVSSPVQTITIGTNWKQVSCGYGHTAAIKTDGTLWTWGLSTNGMLGDNTTTSKSSPVQTVAGGTNWQQVACGYFYTAAIKTDGTLWTWGLNTNGQLGDNTITNRSSPIQTVTGGTSWKQVACGLAHAAAIKTDGTLWLWGNNNNGQLAINTITSNSSPVQTITRGTDWKQVACGDRHTTAIKTDGTLYCWGYNNVGQLGNNTITDRSSPVQIVISGTNWKQVAGGGTNTAAITYIN